MAALRAPGVKHQVVEIPEHEIAIPFAHSRAVAVLRPELDQHPAIEQQGEQIGVQGSHLLAKRVDLVRLRQASQRRGDGGIANPE